MDIDECQECHQRGGKVVTFTQAHIIQSRWICPHCVDALRQQVHDQAESLSYFHEELQKADRLWRGAKADCDVLRQREQELERDLAERDAKAVAFRMVKDLRERVEELERALQETHKNWGETSHYLRTVLAERESLRGRVEELEREARAARADCYSANEACKEFRARAEAVEAKLALERGIIQNEAEENKLEWYAAAKGMRSALSRAEAYEAANVRLRQRVEELERKVRIAVAGESHWERAEAAEAALTAFQKSHALEKEARYQAEAKLARCVEALEWIEQEYPDMGSGIKASAALAAAKGGK